MSKLKRLTMATLSASLLLTQGGPLPYLAYAVDSVNKDPINGEVKFSWTTADQVKLGSTFNPYEGLKVIDADGDNVAVLATVSGEVDTSQVGTYSISYSIENVDGETFTTTRQIEVVESEQDNDETITLPTDTQVDEVDQDVVNESDKDSTEETEKVETVPDEESGEDTSSHPLNDINWMLYDRSSKQELVQFKVNVETGKYEIYLANHLDESLTSLDDEALNEKLLELRIFSSQQVEKLNLSLTLNDLLTQSDEVKALMEISYELGDQVNVIPLIKEKNILVVNGVTGGDISIEQEDYSDGVESEDLIHNVRFVIDEAGLLTLYNEAPIIDGIQNIEVSDIESFDPKEGVTVKDDHDDNLLQHLTTTMDQLDEKTYQVTYQVTDSWGRTTEAVRQVVEVKELEDQVNPLTGDNSTSSTTLADNSITVRGIDYPGTETGDQRFKITFNTRSKRIYITEADGRSMNSRVDGEYFKLVLYNSKGAVKNELVLTGRDRATASSTAAMNELINTGWRYSAGDVIAIWHYEPEGKISIDGTIQEVGNENFGSNVTADMLRLNRFEITTEGLKKIANTAPTFTLAEGSEQNITISRGDSLDLLQGLTILDDHDDIKKIQFSMTNVPVDIVGEYEATITATDTWGESSKYTRKVIVQEKNNLDAIRINFFNANGESVFDLQFDEVTKQIKLLNQSDTAFDSGNSSDVVVISIYNNSGKIRRTVRIKGKDTGNSASIRALQNLKYNEGDYINITPVDEKFVTITGTITGKPENVDYTQKTSDSLDYYKNVRFQLINGEFKYVYNQAPTFSGVGEKTIVRGDNFDPLDGVSVTDDHDTTISNDQIQVSYNPNALNQIGKTTVRYTVTDSWGRTTTVDRTINVTAPNAIENSIITLNKDDEEFVSIGFDSLTKKLCVTNFLSDEVLDGYDHQEAFKLTLYGSTHEEKSSVTLNYHTEITDEFIQQIEALVYEDGDYLTITSPLYNSIEVTLSNGNTQEFEDEDKLMYSRLQISSDGIEVIYNAAPTFEGLDDVKIVYGNEFNPRTDVSVEDDEENLEFTISGNSNVIDDEGHFIATEIGTYQLTYSVTDSYGRTTKQTRTVEIVPVYTTNEVQYTDENNQYLVSIGINESATGFTGTITDLSNSTTKSQDEIVTQDGNLDVPNDTVFKFTVYDTAGNTVSVLEITESTIINEHLFDELKSLTVRPGYRFSIEAQDLTKVKVTGRLEKDSQVDSTDYSNLTESNRDSVENVRFELTENIVKAIYNQAPVITIAPTPTDEGDSTRTNGSTDIIRDKALTKEAYNLLEGVTVTDDKDDLTLTVDNVEVAEQMLVSELNQSVATIGETYTVTYHVEDSWGRLSVPVERQVTIQSAMDHVSLDFFYAGTNFDLDKEKKSMTVTFNMDEGRLIAGSGNMDQFKMNNVQYGAFGVLPKDADSLSLKVILGKDNTYESHTEFNGSTRSNSVSVIMQAINRNNQINYGDKIKVKMAQSPFFFINGTVIDAQEDYTEGAWLGAILADSYFVVTPEGLKQEYTKSNDTEEDFSEIAWYSGVAGNLTMTLRLDNSDTNNMKILTQQYDTEPYLSTMQKNQNVLTLELYRAGSRVAGDTYLGNKNPADLVSLFSNFVVQQGDYFVIKPEEERYLANIKLSNIENMLYFPTKVDYSGVIDDETYFKDVRFYISNSGIVPVYNNGPVFVGADDIDIIVGSGGTFNTKEGVTVTDEIDGQILQWTVSEETIDTSTVGTHTITYTATDSWGRTTTHERTVNVRPALFGNKIQVFGSNDIQNPAFEIIFDNQKESQTQSSSRLGGFSINRYSDDMLDASQPTSEIFKIWVLDADGNEKAKVTLLGRDTATSEKLKALEKIQYEEGDIIKVWRHPGQNTDSEAIETLKITGSVFDKNNNKVDFTDGLATLDKMNNTIFTISNGGLHAYYNEAPQFEGLKDKVLNYGDEFNKLDGVSVTDDYQTLILTEDNVTTNFIKDTVGNYTATYTITDAFGRTTTKTINIQVKSKLSQNKFNIYGDTSSGSEELKFSIGFDELGNRFVLEGIESAEKLSFDGTFQLTVYSRNGNVKYSLKIDSEDDEESVRKKLEGLQDVTLTVTDSISIIHSNPSYVRIDGAVQNQSEDYSDGFSNTMSEVRFQLNHAGLKEIKAKDFTITANSELTIKRGDEYDLLEGVTVSHPTETVPVQYVNVSGFDISQIGEQTVTYTVTDSWGKTATTTRKVTVEPMNVIDEDKIHVLSEVVGAKKLTIGFDALEMKLTATPQEDNIISKLLKDLPTDEVVFSLSIYNNSQELQQTYEFTGNDVNNHTQVMNQINEQIFNYGDYIALTAYNYDKLDFEAIVELDDRNKENPSDEITSVNQVDKEDFILNARFQITEDGLVALYNEAPIITEKDSSQDIEISIGEEDTLINFIEINDDLDELTDNDVEIEAGEDVDFYYPGQYEITYTVTDTWGRSTSLTKQVYVLSELQKNEIIVKSADHQEMFTVGFDSKTELLTMTFNENNNSPLDASKGEEVVMSLTIYDEAGKQQASFSLKGNDTKDKIQQKLAIFINQYHYHYGYYMNISITDESSQNIIVKNVELESNQIPENAYQENVDTQQDFFDNVRFELEPQLGLVAIYNEAPELILEMERVEHIKSLDITDYDLFSGVSITDDKDYLNVEQDLKIYCNPEEGDNSEISTIEDVENIYNSDRLHLGDNKIYYVAVDSWGRESEAQSITLTLTHAMKNTSIVFDRVKLVENTDIGTDNPALTILYDPDTDRLYATAGADDKFKDERVHAYTFDVYDLDGRRVYGMIYGTQTDTMYNQSEYIAPDTQVLNLTNTPSDAAAQLTNFFSNIEVTEGWSFRLRSVQSPFVKINGPIIDAQEDYEQGAFICDILDQSKFYITEEGLKQVYTPPTVDSGLTKITWYSGVAGLKQFDLVYNQQNKTLSVERTSSQEPLDTMFKINDNVFRISIYSHEGNEKFSRWFKSREYGRTVANAINGANLTIEYGDYLEIELIERRRTNMRIYGDLIQNNNTVDLNYYQDGVPDLSYYNEARFYFTPNGLSLDYNEAPVFTGIEDTVLFAGEDPLDLKAGISVTDDNTPDITYKITGTVFNPETDNYDNITELDQYYYTTTPGAQEIYYVAKDSLGRITVEPRFIWVYARSQITVPDESKLVIQEADPTLRTADDVYQYLINMVKVTDEEDDAAGKPIQVTKDNIQTDLNPMIPGEYSVTYTVTDSDGNESSATFKIQVVRSINVSVPRNNIPFQVVTNLLGETTEGQEFISGTIKVVNNYVTDVNVSVKSLTVSTENDSLKRDGTFELVEPSSVDWTTLSEEDTMTKMALGLYAKSGIDSTSSITAPTKDSPIWLTTNMQKKAIGVLPKGTLPGTSTQTDDTSTVITPSEAVLSFTAKYGKNFTSGKHRMQFTMVLEFE